MTIQLDTAQPKKRPAAIRVVLPFVFRHWLHQPVLAMATAGGLLGATVADLFMPVFSGRLVDAMARTQPTRPRATRH
jgi:ATP-binding cassette subfamily B protein